MENEQEIAEREAAKLKLEQESGEVEVKLDDDGNPIEDGEVELDADGNPVEVKPELEPWQQTEDEPGEVDEHGKPVPVATHVAMKVKYKGRLKDSTDENTALREKVEALERQIAKPSASTELPKRPKAIDFDTDEAHEEALEKWEGERIAALVAQNEDKRTQGHTTKQYKDNISKSVDAHYARTEELVKSSSISPDHFKEADMEVRQAVEAILPGKGDFVTDEIISLLGEGSEKVMYFVGRNKAAKAEFQSLLAEDPAGYKAMVYLGQQKERLNNPQRKTSSAPKPANNAKGDAAPSQSGAALKKKYDEAHKKGNLQAAYDFKKKAKAAEVDVSSW